VPRRIQSRTVDFRPKFVDLAAQASAGLVVSTQNGETSYTTDHADTVSEDIFRVLDGATVQGHAGSWHLSVWSVHEVGAERWLQLSATTTSSREDFVVHMAPGTQTRDALACIEAWLGYPASQNRVIHVV